MRYSFKKASSLICIILFCCMFFISCSASNDANLSDKDNSSSPSSPQITKPSIDLDVIAASPNISLKHVPVNKGEVVEESDHGVIDYSSAMDGYFMAKYTGEKTDGEMDIVILVNTPNPEHPRYTYYLAQDGDFYAFPFSEGNGMYTIGMFKRLQGQDYVQLMGIECSVSLGNELLPFLISNYKVRYTEKSLSVKLATELIKEKTDFFDQVSSIYGYVVSNISYDTSKATAAANGELQTYIPDNDQILRSRQGICFDYATLTTAMLRSVGIPTKVTFGFTSTGETADPVYHAWISVYSSESGWVDGVIEFSADGWTRMDPTFSSSSNNKSMANFIGDGDNYTDDLYF